MLALPVEKREIKKINRQYIANVIYTICGKPFADWVDARINERNELRKEEKDVDIEMDPEIAAIFKASTAISLVKGTSNNLMKVSTTADRVTSLTTIKFNR